jgi:hypothetical protein
LIVRLAGLAERVKSGVGGALTVRLTGILRVKPPPTPVIVTVAGPVVAVLDAAKVRVLAFPVVGVGLKLAVTPAGNSLALNATLPVKPPVRVIVIVLVPLAPRLIVKLVGFAASAKSGVGCGFTVRLIVVVRVSPPPVPVMATAAGPSVAVAEAVNVTALLVPVVEAGLKLAVTPVGNPLALSPTLPVKPPVRVIVIALLAVEPRVTLTFAGLADSAKFGVGGGAPEKSCDCGMICFSMPSGVLHESVDTASPPFS